MGRGTRAPRMHTLPSLVAPSYEINRVRPLILSVSSATAALGPLQPNPHFQRSARLTSSGAPERLALWGALGLSVFVLLFRDQGAMVSRAQVWETGCQLGETRSGPQSIRTTFSR